MTIYEVVEYLLKKYPPVRNSDKLLLWNVWGVMGHLTNGIMTRQNFLDAPTPESITRARRKVVELHPELDATDPDVKESRENKEGDKGNFVFNEGL